MFSNWPCKLIVHVVLLPRSRTTTLVGAAAMLLPPLPLEYMAQTDRPARRHHLLYNLRIFSLHLVPSLSLDSLATSNCVIPTSWKFNYPFSPFLLLLVTHLGDSLMRLMRSIIWFTFLFLFFLRRLIPSSISNKNQFKLFSLTLDGVWRRNEKIARNFNRP